MRKSGEMAAVAAGPASGGQRDSPTGGSWTAGVAAVVEAAAEAVVVSSRLAGGPGLVLTPAWTHGRRDREGDSEPGGLIHHIFYFSNGAGEFPWGQRPCCVQGTWDRGGRQTPATGMKASGNAAIS